MKTQFTKAIAMLACLTFCLTAYGQEQKKTVETLAGTWTYSLPDAPYGYQDGTIEFQAPGEAYAAVVKISGSALNIKEIKKDGEVYKCSLYVDGADVDVILHPGTDKMTGTVFALGSEMPLTLTCQK